MTAEALRVARFTICNMGGIKGEFAIENPGALTLLAGENGLGKSSVIRAFAFLCGEDMRDILTIGEESGFARVEVTDGTWFQRTVTAAGKNDLRAGHPEKGSIGKAAGYLKSLIAGAQLSPARLLSASDEEAAEILLALAPLTVTAKEIDATLGEDVSVPILDVRGHALKVLDHVAKQLFDQRTGENRVAKESRATVEQLGQSLPADLVSPREAEAEVERLQAREQECATKVRAAEDSARSAARAKVTGRIDEIDGKAKGVAAQIAKLEAEIAKLNAEWQALDTERARVIEELVTAEDAAVAAAGPERRQELREVQQDLAAARESLRTATSLAATVENTRKMIAQQQAKADAAHAASQALTAAMARIDALKLAKQSSLPIKGASIEGGRLHIGGVPWRVVNTADRCKVALQATIRQDAPVKFMAADGLEALDSKTRAALVKGAHKAGIQMIGGIVTDDPELKVIDAGAGADEPEFAAVGGAT